MIVIIVLGSPPNGGEQRFCSPPNGWFSEWRGGELGGELPPQLGGKFVDFPPKVFQIFKFVPPQLWGGTGFCDFPPKMLGFPPKILASSPPKGEFPPKMLFVPPQIWGGTLPSVPPQLGGELTKKQLWGGTWGGNWVGPKTLGGNKIVWGGNFLAVPPQIWGGT